MRHFKLLMGLSLAFSLLACHPDKKKNDDASFTVKSLDGTAETAAVDESSQWKVPTSIKLGFIVCLEDRASRTDLRSQKFYIDAPGGIEVTTSTEGCLKWDEPLAFNYFAGRSAWVTLHRRIVGRGVNQGTRTVDILVNPWAVDGARDSGSTAVIYQRDGKNGYIPDPIIPAEETAQFLAGTHALQTDSKAVTRLFIPDIKVMAIAQAETSKAVGSSYHIEMEPKVFSLTAHGIPQYTKIQDGEFDVKLQLISANVGASMNQKVLVLDPGATPAASGRVEDGKLRATLFINQTLRANQGSLELAIRITPKATGAAATIKPYNGVFFLGMGTIATDGGGIASECDEKSKDCDFDKVVASTSNADQLIKAGYLRANDRYQFSKLKPRFLAVEPGETATQRTISYTTSTCIQDIYGKPLAYTPLTIRYLHQDKSKVKPESDNDCDADDDNSSGLEDDMHDEIERAPFVRSTDQDGCLNWDGLVFHKYYKPERYVERNIEIEKPSGFKQRFTFYVNPWDTNINFGFDKREMTDEKIQEWRTKPKICSRFFLGSYGYHTVRFLYNIDPYMELAVRKTILMEITPQVLRYSGIKDARKMVEHLRDGIYLMKVAIQKSYLDPRDNMHWLLTNSTSLQAPKTQIGNETPATKDFVTTSEALVRVVDGMIIYPVELTMRDLRLMRVRSNFLIELQTVDERLIQAYHVFRKESISRSGLEDKLNEFKKKIDSNLSWEKANKDPSTLSPALRDMIQGRLDRARAIRDAVKEGNEALMNAQAQLGSQLKETESSVNYFLDVLKTNLQSGGEIGQYLNSAGQGTGVPMVLTKEQNINDNFQLDANLLAKLKKVLNKNDFSKVTLPSKEDVDLDIFVESNSGLKKRSFVGPVIFLSNAYSDSVRATDNLDEVKCSDDKHPKDAVQRSTEAVNTDVFEACLQQNPEHPEVCPQKPQSDADTQQSQQNIKYKENKFFGSLSHLCYKDVDDLMWQEKSVTALNNDRLAAASLKYNFVNSHPFKMDFVSLTDEPLKKFDEKCYNSIIPETIRSPQDAVDRAPYIKKSVKDCLVETKENTLPVSYLADVINPGMDIAKAEQEGWFSSLIRWARGRSIQITKTQWQPSEYPDLFFKRDPNTALALCNLLGNRISALLTETRPHSGPISPADPRLIHRIVAGLCTSDGGLIHDLKYRIERTGDYTFLGGLNLNFNVGESFSMGTSYSLGMEISDIVGAFTGSAGKMVNGVLLKPFSIKRGMSSSEGTSVSQSTYLVSQNAKFEIDLTAYEKCAVVRLSDQAIKAAAAWRNQYDEMQGLDVTLPSSRGRYDNLTLGDFKRPDVLEAFSRGLMVCEGSTRNNNEPKRVEEMYSYFTQHFTEGDMLDPADLYNHPWLLAMRGMRDFVTFMDKVDAQDPVTFTSFAKDLVGWSESRKKTWALEHMSAVYADPLPSFPGYYTLLDEGEDLSAFLLLQSRNQNAPTKDFAPSGDFTKADAEKLTGEDPKRPNSEASSEISGTPMPVSN